ncbi:MAG: GxxExxY protein [Chloroflexota bacterium]
MADMYIIEKELSHRIMAAAFAVHNKLGPGYPEKIYDEAMDRELPLHGVVVESQKRIVVMYNDKPLSEFVLDKVADGRVILEIKAVSQILPIHKQQALSYLKATGLQLAIVINFGAARVQSSRVVYTRGKAYVPRQLPGVRDTPIKEE